MAATAATVLAKLPPDDSAAPEQPPASSSSSSSSGHLLVADDPSVPISKSSRILGRSAEGETANLSPSLIPAPQPTISLLSNDSTDTLSVESLTLVPPVDPDSILAVSGVLQLPALETEVCVETGDGYPSHPSGRDKE